MPDLRARVAAKKAELDRLRPLAPHGLENLDHVQDLELTYTSNAIEGNTLTAVETTLVVEQEIAVGGKPLRHHVEAIDHADAISYVRELARSSAALTESDVRNLHARLMRRTNPFIAGCYADQPRYGLVNADWYQEVPALMGDLSAWLNAAPATPETAFDAHRQLVNIHPFNDGNGRTARLLMNLILLRGGYPPVAVRPQDRPPYIAALQQAQSGGGGDDFDHLLYERLESTLDDYIAALNASLPGP